MHPDRDGCGVLWHANVVPLVGAEVTHAVELASRTMVDAGFGPMIAQVSQHERVIYLYPMFLYDRAQPGRDAAAVAGMRTLHITLQEAGFDAYRIPHLVVGDLVPARVDDGVEVLRRIKSAVDPADILSAGRYSPR